MVAKGEGAMDWEFGVGRYKLLHLEWISSEVVLYSTGNHIQSFGIEHDGKELKKEEEFLLWLSGNEPGQHL